MTTKKIIRIWGGLGNQLFQYSFGKFLEKEHDCTVSYNINWFSEQSKRKFVLDKVLKINNEIIDKKDNFVDRILNYKIEKFYKALIKKNFLFLPKNLIGYWQDLYFAKYLKKNNFLEGFLESSKSKKKEKYYILHFRGGDFYNSKDHIVLNLEYYKKSIDFFRGEKIYCLSDDNNKLELLVNELNLEKVFVPNLSELDAFKLIYNSDGGVASNSTFCWWAAYMSNNKNWVFPKQYIKNKTLISENLYIDDTLLL
jgi:hypothetical protein